MKPNMQEHGTKNGTETKRSIKEKFTSALSRGCFAVIRFLFWLFYPKCRFENMENLPDEPCILVGNHAKLNGPLMAELHLPCDRAIWTAGEMFSMREVPAYTYRDFWGGKPKSIRWIYRPLSYIMAPFCVSIFNNAHAIPVYRDTRVMMTLRKTVKKLNEGANIVIFPEHDAPHNHIVNDFQTKFIETARLYHRRTGKALAFVPMYVAPAFHATYIGKPIRYDPTAPALEEERRIADALMQAITDIAVSLPQHTVTPYNNIRRKYYPKNK